MKRQGQASNSSGLGRIAPLPDSNPTRGRLLCNRKKTMGRNVNLGLTEPSEKVAVSYEVTNEGTEDMPFFVGGHPGFKCPLDEGESYDDYELRFEQREAAELCTAVPSTGLIDVEHRSKNPMVGHDLPLTHELFDFAETIFDVLKSRVVTLTKKTEDKGVRLTFPDMPYLIVWSKPEGDFVAVEPWGGLSTCSDEDDILEHKRGCLVAKPGETVTRGFEIEIL